MKFLLIDAHPMLRERLTAVLRHNFADPVVHYASDESQAKRVVKRHPDLDVVLADFDLLGAHSAKLLAHLAKHAAAPTIVMATSEDLADICHALNLGAKGYLPKSASPTTLASVVRLVAEGEVYVPPVVLDQISPPSGALHPPNIDFNDLTPRQKQILTLLADGKRNAMIAKHLHLAEKTVKSHTTTLYRTLGVSNRHQAAALVKSRLNRES